MTQTTRSVRSSSVAEGRVQARSEDGEGGVSFPESAESSDPLYADIAAGLFHLRRTWAKPVLHRVRLSSTGGRPLQLSNLMVVYAVDGVTTTAELVQSRTSVKPVDAEGPHTEAADTEVTVGHVADRLEIDPSTASRLVGHAISAGLVSRRPSPLDARRASLRLTEAGARVKQVADRYRYRYLATLMADWTDEERAEFARLLTRFTEAAARHPMQLEGVGKIFAEALEAASVEATGPDQTPGPGHHQGGR